MTTPLPDRRTHRAWRSRCRPDCDLAPLDLRHPRDLHRRRPRTWPSALPGLAVAAGATVLSLLVAHLLPGVNAATVAVVLGLLVTNLGLHHRSLHHGTHVSSGWRWSCWVSAWPCRRSSRSALRVCSSCW